ncbi:hypothetical protein RJ639_037793 [Escallonia herrerae]|uniref:Ribosomal protein L37 n=2 Tax=Pentapetalae TaxID=1437201 RepID=A0AA88WI79_9ASTE|nr:hypothetical protein RJ639_037793 [Escallonia herrerae]
MGKGTGSFGKRRNKTHTLCVRCGRRSFHLQKSRCSACAFPAARVRKCKSLIHPSALKQLRGTRQLQLLLEECKVTFGNEMVSLCYSLVRHFHCQNEILETLFEGYCTRLCEIGILLMWLSSWRRGFELTGPRSLVFDHIDDVILSSFLVHIIIWLTHGEPLLWAARASFQEEALKKPGRNQLGDAKEEIKGIVGLKNIKPQLMAILKKITVANKQASLGFEVVPPKPFHVVFFGNDGTGLIRSLSGPELGKGNSMDKDIQEANGRVLCVEIGEPEHDPEGAQQLISLMDSGKTAVIFSGKREELNKFMKMNKRVYERLSVSLHFNDFSCEELATILKRKMDNQAYDEPSYMHCYKLHPCCSVDMVEKIIAKEYNANLLWSALQNGREYSDRRLNSACDDVERDNQSTITLADL